MKWIGAAASTTVGEELRADAAVVFEQREQQLVLAGEAPVERLEREAGPSAHLRDGERRAPGLVGELARRGDEPLGPVARLSAGGRENVILRPS